jgi:hypothetical protein
VHGIGLTFGQPFVRSVAIGQSKAKSSPVAIG